MSTDTIEQEAEATARRTMDQELKVIGGILRLLEELPDDDARLRVLCYVGMRCDVGVPAYAPKNGQNESH